MENTSRVNPRVNNSLHVIESKVPQRNYEWLDIQLQELENNCSADKLKGELEKVIILAIRDNKISIDEWRDLLQNQLYNFTNNRMSLSSYSVMMRKITDMCSVDYSKTGLSFEVNPEILRLLLEECIVLEFMQNNFSTVSLIWDTYKCNNQFLNKFSYNTIKKYILSLSHIKQLKLEEFAEEFIKCSENSKILPMVMKILIYLHVNSAYSVQSFVASIERYEKEVPKESKEDIRHVILYVILKRNFDKHDLLTYNNSIIEQALSPNSLLNYNVKSGYLEQRQLFANYVCYVYQTEGLQLAIKLIEQCISNKIFKSHMGFKKNDNSLDFHVNEIYAGYNSSKSDHTPAISTEFANVVLEYHKNSIKTNQIRCFIVGHKGQGKMQNVVLDYCKRNFPNHRITTSVNNLGVIIIAPRYIEKGSREIALELVNPRLLAKFTILTKKINCIVVKQGNKLVAGLPSSVLHEAMQILSCKVTKMEVQACLQNPKIYNPASYNELRCNVVKALACVILCDNDQMRSSYNFALNVGIKFLFTGTGLTLKLKLTDSGNNPSNEIELIEYQREDEQLYGNASVEVKKLYALGLLNPQPELSERLDIFLNVAFKPFIRIILWNYNIQKHHTEYRSELPGDAFGLEYIKFFNDTLNKICIFHIPDFYAKEKSTMADRANYFVEVLREINKKPTHALSKIFLTIKQVNDQGQFAEYIPEGSILYRVLYQK